MLLNFVDIDKDMVSWFKLIKNSAIQLVIMISIEVIYIEIVNESDNKKQKRTAKRETKQK